MTTIAYKNGILACDKQCTDNGTKYRGSFKATVANDSVYIVTGTVVRGLKFIEWILNGGRDSDEDAPRLKDTQVIQMDLKTGKIHHWEADFPLPVEDRIAAWGSGGDIALGAMAAGASPEAAVKIASSWDDGTGFGVQMFRSERAKKRDG